MNELAQAFGKKFDKDAVRIKTFEYANHTFKVKIPLTSEYESLLEKANIPNEDLITKYYDEITKDLVSNKTKIKDNKEIVFTDTDVLVSNKSMREAAKNKVLTEQRILALIKLLVPEEKGFEFLSTKKISIC